MQKMVLNVDDLATMAGVHKRTVWRAVKHGKLPAPVYAGGRAARWGRADAEKWAARRNGQVLPLPLAPPTWMQPPELVTVEELAEILGMSERGVWRLVERGALPKPEPKPLRPRLWRMAGVWAWIEANWELVQPKT